MGLLLWRRNSELMSRPTFLKKMSMQCAIFVRNISHFEEFSSKVSGFPRKCAEVTNRRPNHVYVCIRPNVCVIRSLSLIQLSQNHSSLY